MITLRSTLFNTTFYANLIIRMIVLSPIYFLMPRKAGYAIPKAWAKSSVWLMEKIVGTSFEVAQFSGTGRRSDHVGPPSVLRLRTIAPLPCPLG